MENCLQTHFLRNVPLFFNVYTLVTFGTFFLQNKCNKKHKDLAGYQNEIKSLQKSQLLNTEDVFNAIGLNDVTIDQETNQYKNSSGETLKASQVADVAAVLFSQVYTSFDAVKKETKLFNGKELADAIYDEPLQVQSAMKRGATSALKGTINQSSKGNEDVNLIKAQVNMLANEGATTTLGGKNVEGIRSLPNNHDVIGQYRSAKIKEANAKLVKAPKAVKRLIRFGDDQDLSQQINDMKVQEVKPADVNNVILDDMVQEGVDSNKKVKHREATFAKKPSNDGPSDSESPEILSK